MTLRRRIWVAVLSVVVAALAGALLPVDPLAGTFIPLLLGWVLGLTLAAHILIGWIPRWRRYFWRIFLALALPLLPLASFTLTFEYIWNRSDAAAHAYVAAVRPILENFHSVHGRYPYSMAEVSTSPPKPHGLEYEYESDENSYVFLFDGDRYSSLTGEWFDDD